MTIWLLALIVLASLAGLGYRQGALRVGVSFFGILLGALLAVPLGRLLKPVVGMLGVKDPLLLWIVPPFIVFVLISAGFKIGAAALHHKVDVYYKYKAGDLRLALWERLNRRLGLCVGLLNGTAYLVLLCFVIYMFSYWTFQIATSDSDPFSLRLTNRLGKDLQTTGLNKVARAVEHLPDSYFELADIAGMIYNTPLAEARLAAYPGFLALAQLPQFQTLGEDKTFAEMRARQAPVMELVKEGNVQAIILNPDLMREIRRTVVPDLKDLRAFLATGKSAKYDPETILGRWKFNVNSAYNLMRRTRTSPTAAELKALRAAASRYEKTTLVAIPGGAAIMKHVPGGQEGDSQPVKGEWKSIDGTKYLLTVEGQDLAATAEPDRLTFTREGVPMVFNRMD